MGDWIEQYSAALDERDAREHAHKSYIDACKYSTVSNRAISRLNVLVTKLADRTSALNIKPTIASEQLPERIERPWSPRLKGRASPSDPPPTTDTLNSLRADLASTQKARAALQTQVDELTSTLKAADLQHRSSTSQIANLSRQKADVERRLRDREEEVRGKAKLATEAQDEMVALSLQLNMAEQKSEKLKKDNKELLDRWMKAKGAEADRMNRDSKWE